MKLRALCQAIDTSKGLVRALLLAGALGCQLSCGDSDDQAPRGPSAGASSAGVAGSSESAAGEAGMDASGGPPETGGGAGVRIVNGFCFTDADCDDGLYCNGVERCKSLSPGSDAKVCMGPEQGPCGPSKCNESTNRCDCSNADSDGDGYKIEGCTTDGPFDCDDTDDLRNPAREEVCDEEKKDTLTKDEDCDENTYVGVDEEGHKQGDVDEDLFFDANCKNPMRYQPLSLTPREPLTVHGTDCDDGFDTVHPGAEEICDGKDNDCDGQTDEVFGAPGQNHTYYKDADGDGIGTTGEAEGDKILTLCASAPPHYVPISGDCADDNWWIGPGREEICDGVDNDCNGTIDQPEKPGDLMVGQPYDGVTEFECKKSGEKTTWVVTRCPVTQLDCNEKYIDACETIATTLCNCHACGNICAFSCGDTGCEEIALLSMGNLHTCAIVQPTGSTTGGTVACWGQNLRGQLGDKSTKDSHRAIRVLYPELTNVTAIAEGDFHSCAIGSGGKVFCWGDNRLGQLGFGRTDAYVSYPDEVHLSSDLVKAKQVGSGSSHSCAIFDEGKLFCWGRGDSGQLGNADRKNVNVPVPVRRIVNGVSSLINDASQVVAGNEHTCSLSAGRVECWGDNSFQQLGVDPSLLDFANTARPVAGLLEGLHVDELSASSFHTCARAGADVYCWGNNADHEIALEDVPFAPPTKIPLPVPALSIATGLFFGCALGTTGTAYCWGSSYMGELGSSYDPDSVSPNPIPLDNVTGIFAGRGEHVCAVTRSNGTWCWGQNDFGQLGNGETSDSEQPNPLQVRTLTGAQECRTHD